MAKSVEVIMPTKRLHFDEPINQQRKRRVAGYGRVSTDMEEQLTSYEAQIRYYTDYIKSREDWEFVGVYTDEGITGTSTKHRNGFKQMIQDALDGKIDLIITKSVSRFARNTVDSLVTVRELKAHNVEVYFEKENIYTFDGKGELLITIMSSLAQEESRSISENVTWGHRRRFADGKLIMPFSSFLGYERGEDGQPQIVESEAKIVRLIYKMFLEGKTPTYIAKYLTGQGIPTPRRCKVWGSTTVESILTNEKYKGAALLQKTFTTDFLTKSKKINEGEIPQYYIENSHPAIVSKEVYDLVQMEFEKRRNSSHYKTTTNCFSSMIFCGDCGSVYGSKVWHSNTKYRRVIWQCNAKFKNEKKCATPHLSENMIKTAFISVMNTLIENKSGIVKVLEQSMKPLSDTRAADRKISAAKNLVAQRSKDVNDYIDLNMRTAIKQEEYNAHFDELIKLYEDAQLRQKQAEKEKTEILDRAKRRKIFLDALKGQQDILTDFDEGLMNIMLEKITVFSDRLEFEFKDGETREYIL